MNKEIDRIKHTLALNRKIILEEFWRNILTVPDKIPTALRFLESAVRVYDQLDDDSRMLVLCAVRHAILFIYFNVQYSHYNGIILEMAVKLIEEGENTVAQDVLLRKMPIQDRAKIVNAIEKAGIEETVLTYQLYYNWDGKLDKKNSYIWLKVCCLFRRSTELFEHEIRLAFNMYEEQVGIAGILQDIELCELFKRLPPFIIKI